MEVWYAALGTIVAVIGVTSMMVGRTDKKIGTVFKRFDTYKEHVENTLVSNKVCDILHRQLNADVAEIKADVKLLVRKANGR